MHGLQGVETALFRPEARDISLRRSWSAEAPLSLGSGNTSRTTSPRVAALKTSRRSSLDLAANPLILSSASQSFNLNPTVQAHDPNSKIVMLYVGRVSWEKNLRLLVEAFRGLQVASADGTRPACQLVFVGDGPSRPELEALCESYGLDAVFMGHRQGGELAAAFASADIFAFPSW